MHPFLSSSERILLQSSRFGMCHEALCLFCETKSYVHFVLGPMVCLHSAHCKGSASKHQSVIGLLNEMQYVSECVRWHTTSDDVQDLDTFGLELKSCVRFVSSWSIVIRRSGELSALTRSLLDGVTCTVEGGLFGVVGCFGCWYTTTSSLRLLTASSGLWTL